MDRHEVQQYTELGVRSHGVPKCATSHLGRLARLDLQCAGLLLELKSWVILKFGTSTEVNLLTEDQVQRSFRKLFSTPETTESVFEQAEEMLDELRPESPLRHRLAGELEELRKMAVSKTG